VKDTPSSLSPIGRLRNRLPAWKKLFPHAHFQHGLIELGFQSVHPGFPGQTKLPCSLDKAAERDAIMEEREGERGVGVPLSAGPTVQQTLKK
jgi:hypothetical protein